MGGASSAPENTLLPALRSSPLCRVSPPTHFHQLFFSKQNSPPPPSCNLPWQADRQGAPASFPTLLGRLWCAAPLSQLLCPRPAPLSLGLPLPSVPPSQTRAGLFCKIAASLTSGTRTRAVRQARPRSEPPTAKATREALCVCSTALSFHKCPDGFPSPAALCFSELPGFCHLRAQPAALALSALWSGDWPSFGAGG